MRRMVWTFVALTIVLPTLLALFALGTAQAAEPEPAHVIPANANQHRRELVRLARQEWGLGANVALAAAQIHAESAWRADARSAYANGMAQFTPTTAAWIVTVYPDLGEAAPLSPAWAMRAMLRYDGWLRARTRGHTACDHWWAVLRSYNGGLGHWRAEAALAADALDRADVDPQCGRASRAAVHCAENLGYPRRILLSLEPVYLAAGWPGARTCPGAADA